MKQYAGIICLLVFMAMLFPSLSLARPEYASQTGFQCGQCHIEPTGGGTLTKTGEAFLHEMTARGLIKPLTNIEKVLRFFIGYIHLAMAIGWFGTILYVHLLLKPAYASRGLPKGELFLGWSSIIILSVTGIILSIFRLHSWNAFYTTRFGILLGIKIIFFLCMTLTAFTVTFYVGPKMKRKWRERCEDDICKGKQDLTIEEFSRFDGRDGRPAYVAYKGNIHDVSNSRLWKDGSHARKHHAGHDLTAILKTAPHGEEKILSMPVVGKLLEAGKKPPKPLHERIFYGFAYLNLGFVFAIIFIIALWRWGQ